METGSQAERTCGKAAAGRPREVADCGAGWSRLQLAGKEQLADPSRQWLVDTVVPHSCTDKPGGTKGERNKGGAKQTTQPRVPARGNKASKPVTEKSCEC